MNKPQSLSEIVEDFTEEVRSGGKKGMWICGPRRSGTSTCARRAVDSIIDNFPELVRKYGQGQKMTAVNLETKMRSLWTQESLMRINASDFSLWAETNQIIDTWEFMWNCSILLIDDIIAVDTQFWKKHLLPRIDQRLKSEVITIFASAHRPSLFGSRNDSTGSRPSYEIEWETPLTDLCRVYSLEGFYRGSAAR